MVLTAMPLVLVMASTPAEAQQAVDCAAGVPGNWELLAERSSPTTGEQILCNYTVTGTEGTQRGRLVGGTAITIEYFCAASDAKERFDGVTERPRDTETKRTDDMVVIEEGPAARHTPNPQDDEVTSTFYPGIFNLFEKEWRLLSPQVFATIVVITDRGEVPEDRRLSVAAVEPIARGLANANKAGAGCAIGDIGGTTGGGGPSTIVIVGGIGLVAAAATAAVKARKKQQAAAGAPADAPVQGVDLSILQIDRNDFAIDASNPATVTLTGWQVRDDGGYTNVPMTIWIASAPGCGVAVVPDQGEGQLIASLSVDPTVARPDGPVQLVANGVWNGKQLSETITVRIGGDLELRLY